MNKNFKEGKALKPVNPMAKTWEMLLDLPESWEGKSDREIPLALVYNRLLGLGAQYELTNEQYYNSKKSIAKDLELLANDQLNPALKDIPIEIVKATGANGQDDVAHNGAIDELIHIALNTGYHKLTSSSSPETAHNFYVADPKTVAEKM